jgi:hypothetical protein
MAEDTAEDRLNWYLAACRVEKINVSPEVEARLREKAKEMDQSHG